MTRRYRDVLMVEDDKTLCKVLERNLLRKGAQVRLASSVGDALTAVSEREPDLVILDIDLPDRTGWDLMRALAAQKRDLPTIVMTGTRVTPERLAQFRPLAYLPKPFPIDALLRIVSGDVAEGDLA